MMLSNNVKFVYRMNRIRLIDWLVHAGVMVLSNMCIVDAFNLGLTRSIRNGDRIRISMMPNGISAKFVIKNIISLIEFLYIAQINRRSLVNLNNFGYLPS